MDAVDTNRNALELKKCKPLQKGTRLLGKESLKRYLKQAPDWKRTGGEIARNFEFKNFYETMDFVNALSFIANRENHHPDLEVSYITYKARYSSHEA